MTYDFHTLQCVVEIQEHEYFLCFTEITYLKGKLYCFRLYDILPKLLCYYIL